MAHWWELWSPGLQAIGGIVELIGAILLALEWRRSVHESLERAEDLRGQEWLKGEMESISRERPDERYDIRDFERNQADMHLRVVQETLKSRRKTYYFGFLVIAIGVTLQVAANAIAWAAAYGLFS